MKLGILNYAYTRYGFEEGMKKHKEHGYDTVDFQAFVSTDKGLLVLPEHEMEREAKERAKLLTAYGAEISQTHGPWRYPVDDSPAELPKRLEFFKKAVRGTAYVGAPNLVIHCVMPFGADTDEGREEMLSLNEEFIGAVCDEAREYGVTVCLENLPFPNLPLAHVKSVTDFVRCMRHDSLKVCLDTGHSIITGEEIGDAVRYIGNDLRALHVHDNMGDKDAHLLPGEGILNFEAFAKALHEVGFNGAFSYETHVRSGYTPEEQDARERALAELGRRLITA